MYVQYICIVERKLWICNCKLQDYLKPVCLNTAEHHGTHYHRTVCYIDVCGRAGVLTPLTFIQLCIFMQSFRQNFEHWCQILINDNCTKVCVFYLIYILVVQFVFVSYSKFTLDLCASCVQRLASNSSLYSRTMSMILGEKLPLTVSSGMIMESTNRSGTRSSNIKTTMILLKWCTLSLWIILVWNADTVLSFSRCWFWLEKF